jgi:hypothetical protein
MPSDRRSRAPSSSGALRDLGVKASAKSQSAIIVKVQTQMAERGADSSKQNSTLVLRSEGIENVKVFGVVQCPLIHTLICYESGTASDARERTCG